MEVPCKAESRRLAALVLLVGAGCATPGPDSTPATPIETVGPFLYARVAAEDGAVPARFSAPLPVIVTPAGNDWSAGPPRSWVHARLCLGDAAMLERLETAVLEAHRAGAGSDALHTVYGSLLDWCEPEPALCEWSIRRMRQGPAALRAVAIAPLASCDPTAVASLSLDGIPDRAVVELYTHAIDVDLPFSERLATALERMAAAPDDFAFEIRLAAIHLGESGDPRAFEVLRAVADRLPEGEHRDSVTLGFAFAADPQLRGRFEALCARSDGEPMCQGGWDPLPAEPEAEPDRRDTAELAACATDPTRLEEASAGGWSAASEVFDCWRRLADVDPDRAVEVATSLQALEDSHGIGATARARVAFPDPGELDRQLRQWGLVGDEPLPEDAPFEIAERISTGGRTEWFDAETDQYPNEHDVLLARLSRYGGGSLRAAVFEEIPPAIEGIPSTHRPGSGQLPGAYVLVGYAAGRKWRVAADDLGDWYDVGRVLGLLNTIARDVGDETRWIALPTGDQTAIVLAAPERGIEQATVAGILQAGSPAAATAIGQAAEEGLLHRLDLRQPE